MKKLVLISVLAFFCANLPAQSLFEGEFILFGLGGQMENFKDDLVSPLKYQGYSGAAAIGWHSQQGPWQNNFDGHIAIGLQSPAALNDVSNETTTISGSLNYSLRYRLINRDKQALFLGICSANLLGYRQHNRYSNSSLSFSNFISYGLSASWQYQPQLELWNVKLPFAWQTELNLPLASYLIMPGYNRQFFNDKAGLSFVIVWFTL